MVCVKGVGATQIPLILSRGITDEGRQTSFLSFLFKRKARQLDIYVKSGFKC